MRVSVTDPESANVPGEPGVRERNQMYFTIRKDSDGYRARLYSGSDLIWWTEGYVRKAGAENAIRIARSTSNATPIRDRT